MVIKVYVSGISASKEVKKKQQRALMILQSIKVPFESIDITEPGHEEQREFMKENCKKVEGNCAPPPHFFNDDDYCGDFDDFDQATEEDRLIAFLKLDPAEYNLNGSSEVPEGLEPKNSGDKGEEVNIIVVKDGGDDEYLDEEAKEEEEEQEDEDENEEEEEKREREESSAGEELVAEDASMEEESGDEKGKGEEGDKEE